MTIPKPFHFVAYCQAENAQTSTKALGHDCNEPNSTHFHQCNQLLTTTKLMGVTYALTLFIEVVSSGIAYTTHSSYIDRTFLQ